MRVMETGRCQCCQRDGQRVVCSRPAADTDFACCRECAREFDESGIGNFQIFMMKDIEDASSN